MDEALWVKIMIYIETVCLSVIKNAILIGSCCSVDLDWGGKNTVFIEWHWFSFMGTLTPFLITLSAGQFGTWVLGQHKRHGWMSPRQSQPVFTKNVLADEPWTFLLGPVQSTLNDGRSRVSVIRTTKTGSNMAENNELCVSQLMRTQRIKHLR